MAHKIKYTCDQCGKPVTKLYGPLFVHIWSDTEPQINNKLELCSTNCLEMYAKYGGKKHDSRSDHSST